MLAEANSDQITDAIEKSVESVFLSFATVHPDCELEDTAAILRFSTGIPHPMGNIVVRTDLTEDAAPAEIQRVVEDAERRSVPFLWFVGPSSRPTNLASLLQDAGGKVLMATPGMAADLARYNGLEAPPAGLRIVEVRSPEELRQYTDILQSVFSLHPDISEMFYGLGQQDGIPHRFYLGYLEGRPVATSMVSWSDGVAGIYCVATVEEARKKGIGAAITARAMDAAKEKGYRYVILQASEDGYGVYKKLGFVDYCQFERIVFGV
jgi:ribosomal protein S18 acetylase RimI-like enzyme